MEDLFLFSAEYAMGQTLTDHFQGGSACASPANARVEFTKRRMINLDWCKSSRTKPGSLDPARPYRTFTM